MAKGYKFAPCGNIDCEELVRFSLPKGVEDNEANVEKYRPASCGSEICSRKVQAEKVVRLREKKT